MTELKIPQSTTKQPRPIDPKVLTAASLYAAELLGLPKDTYSNLYFKVNHLGHVNPANLIKGMHAEGIMAIIRFHGYKFEIEHFTDSKCKLVYSLDNGKESSYTLTMEDAKSTPWIQREFLKEGSPWQTDPAGMLMFEACKMIAKTCFRRLFKVKSKAVLEKGQTLDNKELAKEILKEWIFDVQNVNFDFEKRIQTFTDSGQLAARDRYLKSVTITCLKRIKASLDICDALKLPKELFYDISKHDEYHPESPLYGIRSAFLPDILREKGYIIVPETISRKVCTIRFELDGVDHCRQIVLQTLLDTKERIRTDMLSEESVWNNHTELMLFYETVREAVSKTGLKAVFGGSGPSPKLDPKKLFLDFLNTETLDSFSEDENENAKNLVLEATNSLNELEF